MVLFRLDPASGVPFAGQLAQQVIHAAEIGALRPGDRLPAIRRVARVLGVNVNTVARVYRDLEHAGILTLRQGAGAFLTEKAAPENPERLRAAAPQVSELVVRLLRSGLGRNEIRRLFESALGEIAPQ